VKEKPDLQDQRILDHLREVYGVEIAQVEFLPIGDISSAKYRVVTNEPVAYFLKLRKDSFKEISVLVPHFLHEQGIYQTLSPLKAQDGRLWTDLDAYTCILYPFIEGQNGFQDPLSDGQWKELGAALKCLHSVNLPPDLRKKIPFETYSPCWRERVKGFLDQSEHHSYEDPVAAEMAAILQQHRDEIRLVIGRAE
jgi:spectinomycin phosphotransferase